MYSILFIDDNLDILEANRSYFQQYGFQATACHNGFDALAKLQKQNFDCIVLDVMMPDIDGYEVCAKVREHANIPIIFLSCLDQSDHKIKALMLGGDAYLIKPYDLRELHAQIMACIRRGDNKVDTSSSFMIDHERRIIRLYEHSAILSKKEMALLEILMAHPNTVLTKEKLCAALWPDEQPDENRLQSLMRNLRQKVSFAQSRIGTITSIYGTGYVLDKKAGEG